MNVDKLTYAANLQSLAAIADRSNYRFVKADICDRAVLDELFAEFKPNAVMHLAAESHVDRSISGSEQFIQTNVLGTYALLEAARVYWNRMSSSERDAFRFHHVSTDEVYGALGPNGQFSETAAYDPKSPYSASKASSDHLVNAWHQTYGLPIVMSNSSNNYGPFHFPEKLIPLATLNALEWKPLAIYGNGQHVRDWLYVDDHVKALLLILKTGRIGSRYNVGARCEKTNLEIVEIICDTLDGIVPGDHPRRELIRFVADRPGHDRRYAIDPTKIENELGWRPLEGFEQGIRKTIRWYLDNEAWWRPIRDRIYDGERLGLPGS